jgi:hypothetical protein
MCEIYSFEEIHSFQQIPSFKQIYSFKEFSSFKSIFSKKSISSNPIQTHLYSPILEFISPPYTIQWQRIVSNSVRVSVMVAEDAWIRFTPTPDLDFPVVGVVLGADSNTAVEFYENGAFKISNAFKELLNPGQMESFQFDFNDDRTTLTVAHLDEYENPILNVLYVELSETSGLNPAFIGVYAG